MLACRLIPDQVYLEVVAEPAGDGENGVGGAEAPARLQRFRRSRLPVRPGRGLIVLAPPIGLVAAPPIGMCQVSSVIATAAVGVTVRKGEELSHFPFGDSDIIVLFEAKSNVSFTAQPGFHDRSGRRSGTLIRRREDGASRKWW